MKSSAAVMGAMLIGAGLIGAGMGAAGLRAYDAASSGSGAPPVPEGAAGAPAYLVVVGEVYDRDAFISGYAAKLPPIYARYGGEYLAVGRDYEVLEGEGTFQSYVISKWPSAEAARAFWDSREYTPIREERIAKNWGRFDVYLFDGLAAPTTVSPALNTERSDRG